MFNKLKQFKDLRSQAKTMQNALAQEIITAEKNGIKISINGNMEITELLLPVDASSEKIAASLKDLINDTIKKTQRLMAEKIRSMGNMSDLLSKMQ